MSRLVQEARLHLRYPPLSVRQRRWAWRIHLATPELENWSSLWTLAQLYSQRELAHEVLFEPLYMDDLDAILTYKIWCGLSYLEDYNKAILDGRIPPPRDEIQRDLEGLPVHLTVDGDTLIAALCMKADTMFLGLEPNKWHRLENH